jgi:hypothetical protein
MQTALSPSRWIVVRFVLLAQAALILLVGISFGCSALLSQWRGGSWLEPGNLCVGLVCGLIAWLFVAAFHLRKESSNLAVDSQVQFMKNAQHLLGEMGYEITSRRDDFLDTRPGFHAMLFGAGVQVAVQAGHARITGPKISVERLRTNLRMCQQMSRVHQALEPRIAGEAKLKRVELRLRVTPEQLALVQVGILIPLAKESSVVCELCVLAQSDEGILESTVDTKILNWLDQHGISCEIHKDFIQIVELTRDETQPVTISNSLPPDSADEACVGPAAWG